MTARRAGEKNNWLRDVAPVEINSEVSMTEQAKEQATTPVENEKIHEPDDRAVDNQVAGISLESLKQSNAGSEDYLFQDLNQANDDHYLHNDETPKQENDENEFANYNMVTPPSLADRYVFCSEIGRGSQGKIIRAIRKSDYQTVVIKQLNINSIKNWKEYDLFHREADVLSQLNIDGVAKFYEAIDCLEDIPPCSYIVQEFIPGASLQKMLNDGHRFKQENVFDILIQLLLILKELHEHDPAVIHRDIKPSNIMLTPDDNGDLKVTLIDFGAVANPQVQGGGSTMAGTFGYMPPEQLMGKPEPASDIYAVGALAVQLFCGKSPADIKMKDFRLIFEPEMQDKPHALVTTLRQMLEPKFEDRLVDINEIVQRLDNFKKGYFELTGIADSDYNFDYEQKIKNLRYIGESGSIDLWQQLPDMGRKIPNAYVERLNLGCCCVDDSHYILKKTHDTWERFITLFLIIFFGLVMISCAFAGYPILGLFGVLLWLFVPAVNSIFDKVGKRNVPFRLSPYDMVLIPVEESVTVAKSVMATGRKGMATITDILYLPVSKKDIEHDENIDENIFVNHGLPNFLVKYKFNPPDDNREEDLEHKFITHVEPENHYAVGDPLPILYEIKDSYFYDLVYSMPYPVPVQDMQSLSHLIDCSRGMREEEEETIDEIADDSGMKYVYLRHSIAHSPAEFQTDQQENEDRNDTDNEEARLAAERRRKYQAYSEQYITSYALANATSLKARLKVLSREVSNNYAANKEVIPLLGNYLCARDSKCQKECIKVIGEICFPELSKRSSRVQDAIDPIVTFLKTTPRNHSYPSPAAIRAIFGILKLAWSRNYLLAHLPEAFWEGLMEVYHDDNVAPEVKNRIAADYNTYAPNLLQQEFKEES